jgi:hypothetical protein
MKRISKKAMAIALSLFVMFTAAITSIPARAAAEHIEVQLINFPRGTINPAWGQPALNFMNGWNIVARNAFIAIGASNRGMQVVYCAQPNVELDNGNRNPLISPENFLANYSNGVLNTEQIQLLLGRIFQHGYAGIVSTTMTYDQITNLIATQTLVWEVIVGERAPDFSWNAPPPHLDRVLDKIRDVHPQRALILHHYNRIVGAVQDHSRMPSFLSGTLSQANTHELTWDGTRFSVTLTDTNNMLAQFDFSSAAPGIDVSQSGNQLIISAAAPPAGVIDITATRNSSRGGVIFWSNNPIHVISNIQATVTVGMEIPDQVQGFVRARVSTGGLDIIKTTEHNNGAVAGFQFRVENVDAGQNLGTFTTDATGRIHVPNLQAGRYRVTEINIPASFAAPTPNPVYVNVLPGQTAAVSFNNIRKRGTITVTKLDVETGARAQGNAALNGAVFDIFAAEDVRHGNGTLIYPRDQLVDTIHTGNSNAGTSRVLPLGRYVVVERTAPNGYTLNPARHDVTIHYAGQNVPVVNENAEVHNRVVQGRVSIVKFTSAAGTGNSQIMPPLEGAIFEIYLSSAGSFANALPTERARIATDSNGFAQTPLLPYGSYTIREIYAPGDVRLVDPFQVRIAQDGRTYHFILDNPQFTSLIRIVKVDYTTGQRIPAAGVEFRVRDLATGQWISQSLNYPVPAVFDVFRTAADGALVMPQALPSGEFELWEASAPYGSAISCPANLCVSPSTAAWSLKSSRL